MAGARRFELVILDCDGVLVDSEKIGNDVLANVLEKHGITISGAEARQIFAGQSVDDIRLTAEERFGILMPRDWSKQYYELLIPTLEALVEPIEGVIDVIERIKQSGTRFCVASNGPIAKIRTTLTRVGLWADFDGHAYSAKTISRPKPAPDLFLHAADAYGIASTDCAVVEDSVTGVRAGISAGMTVFAYCNHDEGESFANLGAEVFHAMKDLPERLGLG